MSGSRCKALRRAFQVRHGRPPNKTLYQGERIFGLEGGTYRYVPSEWRRVKKSHRRAASRPEDFSAERAITAAHRLEVRRFLKRGARKRRRAA